MIKNDTVPLEMFIGIVYGLSTDSPVCGIVWNTCTRERCDLDRPYDVVANGCHTWPVRVRSYVMLVGFIPLHVCLLLRISAPLSDMSDSLFTTPFIEMHVSYDDGLKWIWETKWSVPWFDCDESLTWWGLNSNPRYFDSFTTFICFVWRITFACLVVCRWQVWHDEQRWRSWQE
jgi:hypothetical protein